MNVVPLSATTGRDTGKGANRRLRTEGKISGTVYRLDAAPATITIDRSDFRRALTTPAGINALLELSYDGASQYALVKEIQRHPVRRDPIHVDLQRIDPEKPMALTVPIILKGEAKKVTSNGGMVDHVMASLLVSVRPDSIPNSLSVSITDLEIDHTITVGELQLPPGVTTEVDPGNTVVTASLTRAAMVAARAAAKAGEGDGSEDDGSESGAGGEDGGDGAESAESADEA